jgi:hypothetical protein
MSGLRFFQTVMGKRFFDGTLPRAIDAAHRVADQLAVLATEVGTLNRLLEQLLARQAAAEDSQ